MAWTVPSFLDLLKTALDADGTLSGLTPKVQVFTHWPTADLSVTDAVILGFTTRDSQDPRALGRNRMDEQVEVDCMIRVLRSGAGETVAKATRDRATTILDRVDATLRTAPPDVTDDTIQARLATREMNQFPDPGGDSGPLRVCVVDFTITYQARTS